MKPFFKIVVILITFFFFNVSNLYAQEIEDNKEEYERLLDSLGKYDSINPRVAVKFLKQILNLVEKEKDTIKTVRFIHYIGRRSQDIKEYNQSIEYFEKELRLLSTLDSEREKYRILKEQDFTKIEVLAQLGQNYKELGQFEKAFSTYDKCVEIANKEELEFYIDIIPALIADLHFTMGNYKQALIKNKESFNALETTRTISEGTRIYNRGEISVELSKTYLKLNEKDSALWVIDQAFKEKLDTLNINAKIILTAQKGRVYLEKGKNNKALANLLKAKNLAYKYDSITAPQEVSLELGECYFNLKEFDKAIEVLEKGIDVKKQRTKEIYLTEDYKLLAKIYKEVGNLEKSNENFEKYILNQTALEKSKDTISSTFHAKQLSNLEREKSSQKNKFSLVVGLVFVVALGLLFLVLYLFKEKKKNAIKFKNLVAKANQDSAAKLEIIDTKDSVLEEKVSAEVNQETTEQILSGLQKLKEQEYFLKQECNSYNVAKKIKTNTSYLSKVINSHFEKNFNTYINDLRINYAVLRLKNDSRFRSFSVQSIAEELGYKSADSFTKYFKLRTGLNPSFYIKQLNSLS